MLVALLASALAVLMSQPLARYSGAGKVAFNLAVLFATTSLGSVGMLALFASSSRAALYYLLSLGLLGVAAALLTRRRLFDVTALSVIALGLIILLIAGLVRVMTMGRGGEIGMLLVAGIATVGLMALAVRGILALMREYGSGGKP